MHEPKPFRPGCLFFFILWMVLPVTAYAQVPPTMNYQGVLVDRDGLIVTDGAYTIIFSIYDVPSEGTPLWAEEQTVVVAGGLYSIVMGNASPIDLPFNKPYYLGVTVEDDPEMVPRQPLTSVAYAFHAKTTEAMPIGTVIDWWRPDTTWSIPDGFQVCDGSTVNDPDSPLDGRALPDLTNTFVMGVSHESQIGIRGGSESHTHAVDIDHDHAATDATVSGSHRHATDPPAMTTSSSGTHYHSVDIPSFSASLSSQYAGSHNHKWAEFYRNPTDGVEQWITYTSGGGSRLTTVWDNGIGNEGSGHYPLSEYYNNSFYTLSGGNHRHDYSLAHDHPAINSGSSGTHSHSVDLPTVYSNYSGTHSHSVDLPALGSQLKNTGSTVHLPPYMGLLKIMRIK